MRGLLSRLGRAAVEDVRFLTPSRVLAEIAARALPQQSFGRVRTVLLRAAGVEIGSRSLVLGPLRLTGTGGREARLSIGAESLISGHLHRSQTPSREGAISRLKFAPNQSVRGENREVTEVHGLPENHALDDSVVDIRLVHVRE